MTTKKTESKEWRTFIWGFTAYRTNGKTVQYKHIYDKGWSKSALTHRQFMNWLPESGFSEDMHVRVEITKDELIEKYSNKTRKIGGAE